MEAKFPVCGRIRSDLWMGDEGIGGGGRLTGLANELGREEIGTGRRWGDEFGEVGFVGRMGGGGGGRLEDLRSEEEEADLR